MIVVCSVRRRRRCCRSIHRATTPVGNLRILTVSRVRAETRVPQKVRSLAASAARIVVRVEHHVLIRLRVVRVEVPVVQCRVGCRGRRWGRRVVGDDGGPSLHLLPTDDASPAVQGTTIPGASSAVIASIVQALGGTASVRVVHGTAGGRGHAYGATSARGTAAVPIPEYCRNVANVTATTIIDGVATGTRSGRTTVPEVVHRVQLPIDPVPTLHLVLDPRTGIGRGMVVSNEHKVVVPGH